MIRKLLLATAALTVLAGCNQATEQGAANNQAALEEQHDVLTRRGLHTRSRVVDLQGQRLRDILVRARDVGGVDHV
ncbi:MAG: hypothetical protein ACK46X_19350, partial [Candidatus Sericytochromatia bacterium]